jgi:hypothetical protein
MEQTVLRFNELAILRQIQCKNIKFNRVWIYISGIIDTSGLLNFIIINF